MIWILLIVYQIKHFVADYPLQGRFMLGKFLPYPDYVMPLFCHCLVHFVGTFLIACFVDPDNATWYALLDGGIHFIVDRIKASPDMLGKFKALSANEMRNILSYDPKSISEETRTKFEGQVRSNKYFWWCLGWDQAMHHLTHYLIIYLMIGGRL